jgi:hypothetical protein
LEKGSSNSQIFKLKNAIEVKKLESKKREDVYYDFLQQFINDYKNDDTKNKEKEKLWINFKSNMS